MGQSLARAAKNFSNLLELIEDARQAAAAAHRNRRFIAGNKRRLAGLQGQSLLAFADRRFAFDAENNRRALLGESGLLCRQRVQGEGKVIDRDREVQLGAVLLRLRQQLDGRFGFELNVGNQLRNIDVLRRQAGAQHAEGGHGGRQGGGEEGGI